MSSSAVSVRTRALCAGALCVGLICVCSWISVPAQVPFTLQTFAVFLTLALLGGRTGSLAVAAYLLLGAAGVPVFSGFQGGIGSLLGTTGGYLLGFLFTGLVFHLTTRAFGTGTAAQAAGLFLGLLVCYAFGTAWFLLVYARASGPLSLGTALSWCVLPFVIPDLCKLALALTLARRLHPYVHLS